MPFRPDLRHVVTGLSAALLLAGCATKIEAPLRPDTIFAVTQANTLIRFNAGRPAQIEASRPVNGLAAGEKLLAIDIRPSNGALYAAGSNGSLYVLNTDTGLATAVGQGNFAGLVRSSDIGFDFNPVADRIRMVDSTGNNLRLHPETGALLDGNSMIAGVQPDVNLVYSREDSNFGRIARVVAVAYTNAHGAKATTAFAIESAQATLVTIGRPEGTTPAKTPSNPNEGQLFTIGRLGYMTGAQVGFDIHPARRSAYASLQEGTVSVLYEIDLASGSARRIGIIGDGTPVRGISIAP